MKGKTQRLAGLGYVDRGKGGVDKSVVLVSIIDNVMISDST